MKIWGPIILIIAVSLLWIWEESETRKETKSQPIPFPATDLAAHHSPSRSGVTVPVPWAADFSLESDPAEEARIKAWLAFLDALRSNSDARPHLEAIIDYLQNAAPESFSTQNLPRDAYGLARLDGSATAVMIKDPRVQEHWNALMEIIMQEPQLQSLDAP